MENNSISWNIENNIAYINLQSPPKNEMNTNFFEEFTQIISQIECTESLRGLIINAKRRHFSSGANVEQLLGLFNEKTSGTPQALKANNIAFQKLTELTVPVIACLKGICFGSALELALCAHFRIASKNTLMSFPETGFDIIPGLGGIYNSTKCMGKAESLQFVLSGNTISAIDANKSGLIDILADKHELDTRAKEIIEKISSNYKKEFKLKYLRLINNNETLTRVT